MANTPWQPSPENQYDPLLAARVSEVMHNPDVLRPGAVEHVYAVAAGGITHYRGVRKGLDAQEHQLLHAMEHQGYLQVAPRFTNQLQESDRTNMITYAVIAIPKQNG